MIEITEAAAKQIKEIMLDSEPNKFLRIYVEGGGCSGMRYGFDLEEFANEDDFPLELKGVNLLIDAISMSYLNGVEVDYKEDLIGGPRHRKVSTGTSLRMLTREDGVGFSFHDTELEAGTTTTLQYKNHIEANYIIDGTGELENLETGEVFEVRAGMTYTLDKHDRHEMRTHTKLRIICVFTPALVGTEVHDDDGSYPLL
jgi:L-ectoine synthase